LLYNKVKSISVLRKCGTGCKLVFRGRGIGGEQVTGAAAERTAAGLSWREGE
jgi:hypothetical protein